MPAQWAHLGADGVLVASSRGAWIQEPGFVGMLGPLGLVGPMPDSLPATEETTRQLLDGAIAAAERAAPRVQEPPITALRWAWNLVSQWHCAHHRSPANFSVPLDRRADRFEITAEHIVPRLRVQFLSERAVESATSQKSAVTTLRASSLSQAAGSGAPHAPQKRKPRGLSVPQRSQMAIGS